MFDTVRVIFERAGKSCTYVIKSVETDSGIQYVVLYRGIFVTLASGIIEAFCAAEAYCAAKPHFVGRDIDD